MPFGVSTQAGADRNRPRREYGRDAHARRHRRRSHRRDTHTDTHAGCLVEPSGRETASVTVEATADGYAELLTYAAQKAPGPRLVWAVEGCRSHGVGLLRVLLAAGQQVVEASRPQRATRRPGGESDPADALLAARTALADVRQRGSRFSPRIAL